MTLAMSPEKKMSLAPMVSSTRSRLRSAWWRRAAASSSVNSAIWARTVPEQGAPVPGLGHSRALVVEESGIDSGARAAEWQERDGKMRVLDRERERGAHLVAVERAVAGAAEPARALLRPLAGARVVVRHRGAGFVAAEARPPRPVIFTAAEALEAKALVGQPHRPVGIAFTRRDRISHAGDERIAHDDLADQPQRRTVGQNDVDARDGRPVADEARLHFFVARTGHLPRVAVAVVEGPGATFIRRQGSGKRHAHAVVARRQIALAFPVAIAEFQEPAGAVDAQPFDQVARPAAAVALACQAPLGRQHATAVRRGNVTLEVGLVAEQAEPVLDFPLDVRCGAGGGLRMDSVSAPGREQEEEANDKERAHGILSRST